MTKPNTHPKISTRLCGEIVSLSDGEATTRFVTTEEMGTDDRGLVHGGFVFGLADHAAMLAEIAAGPAPARLVAAASAATATRSPPRGRAN